MRQKNNLLHTLSIFLSEKISAHAYIKISRIILLFTLTASSALVNATQPIAMPSTAAIKSAAIGFDFTLATLDGGQFVRLAKTKRPILVNFWSPECPPCITELPLLEKFSMTQTKWSVLLVSTDTVAATRDFLEQHPTQLPILRSGVDITGLMRSAGNRLGALPFSIALGANGDICFRKLGVLNESDFKNLMQVCL